MQNTGFFTDSRFESADKFYAALVSSLSLILVLVGVGQIASHERALDFILLGLVAVGMQTAVAKLVSYKIDVLIVAVFALAMLPLFGVMEAAVLLVACQLVNWLLSEKKATISFSVVVGVWGLTGGFAGVVFMALESSLSEGSAWRILLPWLPAAMALSLMQEWLQLYLSKPLIDEGVNWRKHVRNTAVVGVSSGILAFAFSHFGWMGIFIFCVPIFLTAVMLQQRFIHIQAELLAVQAKLDAQANLANCLEAERIRARELMACELSSPLTTLKLYAGLLCEQPEILQQKPQIAAYIKQSEIVLARSFTKWLECEDTFRDA